jgi:tRNA(Ile)-lysidine synthase
VIDPLKSYSLGRIANVLRVWLKKNQIRLPSAATFQRIIHEVLFASSDAMPLVTWDNIAIRRYQDRLYIVRTGETKPFSGIEWSEFPQPLVLGDTGISLIAKKSKEGLRIPSDARLYVTFRQGGELLFLHGQNKQLKKLFQEWGVPPWQRQRIPLVYINEQLSAVVGYAVSDLFYSENSCEAWLFSSVQGSLP